MGYACNLYKKVCRVTPCVYEQGFGYLEMEKCQLLALIGLILKDADKAKNIMNRRGQLLSSANQLLQRCEMYNKDFRGSKEWMKIEKEVEPLVDIVRRMILKLSSNVIAKYGSEYKNTRGLLKKDLKELKERMRGSYPKYVNF